MIQLVFNCQLLNYPSLVFCSGRGATPSRACSASFSPDSLMLWLCVHCGLIGGRCWFASVRLVSKEEERRLRDRWGGRWGASSLRDTPRLCHGWPWLDASSGEPFLARIECGFCVFWGLPAGLRVVLFRFVFYITIFCMIHSANTHRKTCIFASLFLRTIINIFIQEIFTHIITYLGKKFLKSNKFIFKMK